MDDEFDDDIDSLEGRIEALAAEIVRCRKLALAARTLIVAGGAGLALLVVGLVGYAPEFLVAALAALLGGVVLLGSNASTWEQTDRALAAAQAMRSDLIARMPLRLVGEERPTLH